MKDLTFAVTTDLSYDQRMIRICSSLAEQGYAVTLVGRKIQASIPLRARSFRQKRINCYFEKGKAFYLEYNARLFFYLLFRRTDLICAIDLDTILACYFVSALKNVRRTYDAHELFCEMKEVVTRPFIYRIWKTVEKFAVPKFAHGYTVNEQIAGEFKNMYGVSYEVIRSISMYTDFTVPAKKEKYLLYQGSVNEGRSFETLIPAMKHVDARLVVCGDGNYMERAKALVRRNGLQEKVVFKGKIEPGRLFEFTLNAWIGITLFENKGLSNYFSLANRFFDYMHAGIPQLCVDYPAYREINNLYEIAVLIDQPSEENIAAQCNRLLLDDRFYQRLQQNCLQARQVYNWQNEEKKLISFYKKILN